MKEGSFFVLEKTTVGKQQVAINDMVEVTYKDGSSDTESMADTLDTPFTYLPLAEGTKQFRLITLLAGQGNDPLRCLLHHGDLGADPPPQYETISYCWGDANKPETIIVNGIKLPVPASAASALRCMRLPDSGREVWLDAICINQSNIEERSQQVTMMGDLYRNGIRNLIYLGEEDVEQAMKGIRGILNEARADHESFAGLRNEAGAWQYSSTGIAAEYDSAALVEFFRIPWFRRLWVLQEAALSHENICFCGPLQFDLLEVTRAAAWLIHNYYFVNADLRLQCSYTADMNDLVDNTYGYHRMKGGHPASALYLLDLAQQRLAKEAVDKVYGIIGLTVQLRIVPDYKKNLAEVFQDVAWCLIQDSGNLQILDYLRHRSFAGELQLDGFPSWVPRWDKPKDLTEDPNFMSLSFDACSGMKPSRCAPSLYRGESGTLEVQGIKIDKVQSTTERVTPSLSSRADSLDTFLSQIQDMVSKAHANTDANHDPDLSLATTMVAGVDIHYKPTTPDITKGYIAFCKLLGKGVLPPSMSEVEGNLDQDTMLASQYREAMWGACMNRSFFVTASGYFGLGPHFMRQGDVVAILYGLQFPAVLRPVSDHYIFLGTAYVHGIMHGERVREHESTGVPDHIFHIR